MTRSTNNLLRFAVITLALIGMIGTCAEANAAAPSTYNASQIVDFDGDGRSDPTLFDTTIARWFKYDFFQGTTDQYDIGSPGVKQAVGDYDGDGRSDIAYYYDNPITGVRMWHTTDSISPKRDIAWGSPGDISVPADYDGDGKTDIAVFRPSQAAWYIRLSTTNSTRIEYFGYASDKLVPADYDGDGIADVAVMRPSLGAWYILYSSDHSFHAITWEVTSLAGDVMVPADYDGDGLADIGVYRHVGGLWTILESSSGSYRTAQFGHGVYTGDPNQAEVEGDNLDLPMPGDFDGDGIIDIAVWNTDSKIVNVLPSSSSIMTSMPVGTETSRPVGMSVVAYYLE